MLSRTTAIPIKERPALDQKRAQMVRPLLRIDDNDERSFRRNGDEIRMRDLVAFAARGVNLIGNEGHASIEFPD